MADGTSDSDRTIADAGAMLARQRDARVVGAPIGDASRALRRQDAVKRLTRLAGGAGAVLLAAMVAGIAIGGIGFIGVMLTALALVAVGIIALRAPALAVPSRDSLLRGDLARLVGRTQLWLEAQRPALPAPAAHALGDIGTRLDTLNAQLAGLGDDAPAALEVRRLVGEQLPGVVAAYTAIPATLRGEAYGGGTPDAQIAQSLARIGGEIGDLTRQLADGALDDLAIRTRYLDTRYGEATEPPPLALPEHR